MRLNFRSETLEKVSRVLSLISKIFEIVEIQKKGKFLDVRYYITLNGNCEILLFRANYVTLMLSEGTFGFSIILRCEKQRSKSC